LLWRELGVYAAVLKPFTAIFGNPLWFRIETTFLPMPLQKYQCHCALQIDICKTHYGSNRHKPQYYGTTATRSLIANNTVKIQGGST
jgi:hypothetical protein